MNLFRMTAIVTAALVFAPLSAIGFGEQAAASHGDTTQIAFADASVGDQTGLVNIGNIQAQIQAGTLCVLVGQC
jgi:hypothetical protein